MDKKLAKKLLDAFELIGEVLEAEGIKVGEEEAPAKTPAKTNKKAPVKPAKEEVIEEETGNILEIDGTTYDLDKMTVKQIKKMASDVLEIEFDSDKKEVIIQDLLEYVASITGDDIEDEAEVTEDDEIVDDGDDEQGTAEKYGLDKLELADLKELCESAELSVKGNRQALIDRLVEALESGEIEMDVPDAEGDSEIEDEEQEVDRDPDVVAAEEKVEKDCRKLIANKKLTVPAMKKILTSCFDGDPNCKDCTKCTNDEVIHCYIDLQKSLVDDEADKHELEDPYVRDGEQHCCGTPLKELDNKHLFCERCGSEYGEVE